MFMRVYTFTLKIAIVVASVDLAALLIHIFPEFTNLYKAQYAFITATDDYIAQNMAPEEQ